MRAAVLTSIFICLGVVARRTAPPGDPVPHPIQNVNSLRMMVAAENTQSSLRIVLRAIPTTIPLSTSQRLHEVFEENLVHQRRRISADTALRLARYCKSNPEFWLNLQTSYEPELTRRSGIVSDIERHVHPSAQLLS